MERGVELTRVHYFESVVDIEEIATISRIVSPPVRSAAPIIKKNIFGPRWVLKINHTPERHRKKTRIWGPIYLLGICSILVAILFGIVYTIERKFHRLNNDTYKEISANRNNETRKQDGDRNFENFVCTNCTPSLEVCLNVNEEPKCLRIIDGKDPTGCGGICKINYEFCKLLDHENHLYQCIPLRENLNCSNGTFSCGKLCVSEQLRCDGIINCLDGLDEHDCNCNLTTHFQCGNETSCLDDWKKCDGRVDCWDNSDEIDCLEVCEEGKVSCLDGECIKKEHFCDGTTECTDGSDEPIGCEL